MKKATFAAALLRHGSKGDDVRRLQTLLGVTVDGDFGPQTEGAVRAFQTRQRLTVDGIVGPETWAALGLAEGHAPTAAGLPWMTEAMVPYGWHERTDNARLRAWLRSDGKTLGDPVALPWCGDYVETAIRNSLPAEPMPGALGQNPYWARNWALLGQSTVPTFGCVLVFERGSGGHVGFAVGHDAGAFHVLGGNQSNRVSVTRIDKGRLLAARWPATFPTRPINLPARNPGNLALSTNEV